jgi:hypothetical protein
MSRRLVGLMALLLLAIASMPSAVQAGPYDVLLCPMYTGQFLIEGGLLWFSIEKWDGAPVEKGRREKIANPPQATASREALSKRGAVKLNAHPAEEGGGLVVHWESLTDEPAKSPSEKR